MRNLPEIGSILIKDATRTKGANVDVSPEMLEAAQQGRTGVVVRLARQRTGMTQADLAAAIGYSQTAVSRIERGRGSTAHDVRTLRMLASTLTIPATLLGVADPGGEEEPVQRREFLRLTSAAVAGAVAPELVAHGTIGKSDVDEFARAIADLRALDQCAGGDRLHILAAQQVRQVQRLLHEGRYGGAVERQLHSTLADAAILAGWLNFDAGHHETARAYFADAITATFSADDPLTQAYALSLMAMQAQHIGQPREAVRLAQAGQRTSGTKGGNRLRALLQVREARGLAVIGDRTGAELALARAERVLSAPSRGHDPSWVEFFDQAEFAGAAGMAFTALGEPDRGAACLRDAVEIVGRSRNRLSWEFCLANSQAAAGDPIEACATATAALPLLSEVSSARVRRQLQDVVTAVAPHRGVPEVRRFTGQAGLRLSA